MSNLRAIRIQASLLLILGSAIVGCGGKNSSTTASTTNCTTTISVFPQNATLSHASAGNTQQFGATLLVPTGCTGPTVPTFGITWATSNPGDVPISNNHDLTNGTATCLNATPEPVTVIATLPGANGNPNLMGTASLVCN